MIIHPADLPYHVEIDEFTGQALRRWTNTQEVEAIGQGEVLSVLLLQRLEEVSKKLDSLVGDDVKTKEPAPEPNPKFAKVNVNTSDEGHLRGLPGVNSKVLASIVEARKSEPFADLEDFIKRSGLSVSHSQKGNLEKQITF
jgi:DNA uptake protein ComE-like DNA-binding protein